jgi:hypothetical protein
MLHSQVTHVLEYRVEVGPIDGATFELFRHVLVGPF